MSATVVLVHGAWHGAWCWQPVSRRLRQRGIETVAVDLPGHGESPEPLSDFAADVDTVRRAVEAVEGPVVLVGHSYGGAVIGEAGTSGDVRHLVYVCAFMLDQNESLQQLNESGPTPGFGADDLIIDENFIATVRPESLSRVFYADCPHAVPTAEARLVPEDMNKFRVPATVPAWWTVPSTYLVCTQDEAIHPDLQRRMAARAGSRIEMEASHSPFFSRPDELVDLLIERAISSL